MAVIKRNLTQMSKRVKLFEDFHNDLNAMYEGMFGEIDILGKEAATKDDFKKAVKDFLKKNAADPKVADDDAFIDGLAKTYFDEDGTKKDVE